MATFFGDGFDLYSAITDCGSYWDATFGGTATLALSASGRFPGSRGLTYVAQLVTPYITKTSGANDAIHHISVAFQSSLLSSANNGFFVTFFDGATAQCSICFTGTGNLLLISGAATGTTLATYTSAVAAINTWYQFEIEVFISATAGYMNVRRNGNTSNDFASATNLNTRAGTTNNYANKIGLGIATNIGTSIPTIDDFLWRSDAASVPWIGDVRCFTRMPATDASVAWSRSGTVVPVTPYIGATTTQTIGANSGRYVPFVPPCDGTLGSATLTLNLGYTGNMKCSLFANAAGLPTTVLGSATSVTNPVTGNNTFTFGTPVAVTRGTQYWLGFISDTAVTNGWSVSSTISTTGAGSASNPTYAAFPVANPPGITSTNSIVMAANVTPTSANNAPFVADIQQDAAAGYVFSSTVSQSDLYGIAAIGSTPSTIIGVTTRAYCQKSDAGTRNVAVQLQSGATNVQSASTALNTTWGHIYRVDLTDPATGSAWTPTGVNNATIGVVVTA